MALSRHMLTVEVCRAGSRRLLGGEQFALWVGTGVSSEKPEVFLLFLELISPWIRLSIAKLSLRSILEGRQAGYRLSLTPFCHLREPSCYQAFTLQAPCLELTVSSGTAAHPGRW